MKIEYTPPGKDQRACRHTWFDTWDWLVNSFLSRGQASQIALEPGQIAIDPHVHTLFSHCSISQPIDVILRAVECGLGGIAVLDHNTTSGAKDALKCCEYLKGEGLIPEDFIVIPGTEMNTTGGHVGALFVEEDLENRLTPEKMVEAIHNAGGLAVAVHPFHSTGIGDAVYDSPFDAIETCCGSVFDKETVRKIAALSQDERLSSAACLGASDAHYIGGIATCYTVLDVSKPSLQAVRDAIVKRKSRAVTSPSYNTAKRTFGRINKLK